MMQRRGILFKHHNSVFLNLTQVELVKKLNKVHITRFNIYYLTLKKNIFIFVRINKFFTLIFSF
jgi:hypothetical protein